MHHLDSAGFIRSQLMTIDIFHIFKITVLQHMVVRLYNFNYCSTYKVIYCPQMIQLFFCSLRENSVCFPISSKEEFLTLPLIFLFPVITQTPNSPPYETFPSHELQSLGFLLPISSFIEIFLLPHGTLYFIDEF